MRVESSMRGQRGFTLVEILVATTASVLLVAAVYSVFAHGSRLRDEAVARMTEEHQRRRADATLRRDLRHALVSGGLLASRLEGGERGPDSQTRGYLSFTAASARLADGEFGGEVQEVTYYVRPGASPGAGSGGELVRVVDRNLLAPVREPMPEELVLPAVSSLEVSFFDGQQWVEAWDAGTDGAVPRAVRVRVRFSDDASVRNRRPLDMIVPWTTTPVSAPVTNAAPATEGGAA